MNLDFADVKTVMENMGMALMGTGTASGEHRAVEAAQRAISNPLLEEQSIQGARAILINVTGGEDLTLAEVNEACAIIQAAADEEANVIFGLVQDKDMKDEVKISVIATGFDAPAALASRREVSLPVTPSGVRPRGAERSDRRGTASARARRPTCRLRRITATASTSSTCATRARTSSTSRRSSAVRWTDLAGRSDAARLRQVQARAFRARRRSLSHARAFSQVRSNFGFRCRKRRTLRCTQRLST